MTIQRVDWEAQTPTFEDRQIREVYARFGLAVYFSQCVERQLGVVLATMSRNFSAIATKADFDLALDKEFAKTMGQMARDLAQASSCLQLSRVGCVTLSENGIAWCTRFSGTAPRRSSVPTDAKR